jgi:hypothetical protein
VCEDRKSAIDAALTGGIGDLAGLEDQLGGINVVQADYNNDGRLDLFLMRGGWEGPIRNWLLRNNGDDTFTDVTRRDLLAGQPHDAGPRASGHRPHTRRDRSGGAPDDALGFRASELPRCCTRSCDRGERTRAAPFGIGRTARLLVARASESHPFNRGLTVSNNS